MKFSNENNSIYLLSLNQGPSGYDKHKPHEKHNKFQISFLQIQNFSNYLHYFEGFTVLI